MKTHGMFGTAIYGVWGSMKQRCYDINQKFYKDYGGRGIKVCDRWQSFEGFYNSLPAGYSKGLTLDRIDNDGDYTPENCRWATRKEQANNRRSNKLFTIKGETRNIKQWAESVGLSHKIVHQRIYRDGRSIESALLMEQEA